MSPEKFTIQLKETITDPVQLAQAAQDAAALLGTNADQMEALLARGVGARIARAGQRKRAEQVATLLRQVGISVEVLEPEAALVGVGALETPKAEPAWTGEPAPAQDAFSRDEEDAPQAEHSPLAARSSGVGFGSAEAFSRTTSEEMQRFDELFSAPPATHQTTFDPPESDTFDGPGAAFSTGGGLDPFAAPEPAGDPFAASQYDPFATGEDDPFSEPAGGLQASRQTRQDPFASSENDPFAPPATESDATPSDPFASAGDPFSPARKPGAATILREDPFAEPINLEGAGDPFAAPGTAALSPALEAEAAQTAPAKGARRTSLRGQMLLAVFAPVLLVAASVIGFLFYSVPNTVTLGLEKKGKALAELASQGVYEDMAAAPQVESADNLTRKAFDLLTGAADGAFVAYVKAGKPVAWANRAGLEAENVASVITAHGGSIIGNDGMAMTSGDGSHGTNVPTLALASSSIQDLSTGGELGRVYVALDTNSIQDELLRTIVPILAAIGLALAVATAVAFGMTGRFMRPITAATEQANRISLGDLDQSVPVDRNDEIGDLLEGLERMRVSLKSMVARMRRGR